MTSDARDRPRLTPKGERARARIVEAAARLIHERGVAGTTLEDVRAAAQVSGSQLYHYFPDKDHLVHAVTDHRPSAICANHPPAALATPPRPRPSRSRRVRMRSKPFLEVGLCRLAPLQRLGQRAVVANQEDGVRRAG